MTSRYANSGTAGEAAAKFDVLSRVQAGEGARRVAPFKEERDEFDELVADAHNSAHLGVARAFSRVRISHLLSSGEARTLAARTMDFAHKLPYAMLAALMERILGENLDQAVARKFEDEYKRDCQEGHARLAYISEETGIEFTESPEELILEAQNANKIKEFPHISEWDRSMCLQQAYGELPYLNEGTIRAKISEARLALYLLTDHSNTATSITRSGILRSPAQIRNSLAFGSLLKSGVKSSLMRRERPGEFFFYEPSSPDGWNLLVKLEKLSPGEVESIIQKHMKEKEEGTFTGDIPTREELRGRRKTVELYRPGIGARDYSGTELVLDVLLDMIVADPVTVGSVLFQDDRIVSAETNEVSIPSARYGNAVPLRDGKAALTDKEVITERCPNAYARKPGEGADQDTIERVDTWARTGWGRIDGDLGLTPEKFGAITFTGPVVISGPEGVPTGLVTMDSVLDFLPDSHFDPKRELASGKTERYRDKRWRRRRKRIEVGETKNSRRFRVNLEEALRTFSIPDKSKGIDIGVIHNRFASLRWNTGKLTCALVIDIDDHHVLERALGISPEIIPNMVVRNPGRKGGHVTFQLSPESYVTTGRKGRRGPKVLKRRVHWLLVELMGGDQNAANEWTKNPVSPEFITHVFHSNTWELGHLNTILTEAFIRRNRDRAGKDPKKWAEARIAEGLNIIKGQTVRVSPEIDTNRGRENNLFAGMTNAARKVGHDFVLRFGSDDTAYKKFGKAVAKAGMLHSYRISEKKGEGLLPYNEIIRTCRNVAVYRWGILDNPEQWQRKDGSWRDANEQSREMAEALYGDDIFLHYARDKIRDPSGKLHKNPYVTDAGKGSFIMLPPGVSRNFALSRINAAMGRLDLNGAAIKNYREFKNRLVRCDWAEVETDKGTEWRLVPEHLADATPEDFVRMMLDSIGNDTPNVGKLFAYGASIRVDGGKTLRELHSGLSDLATRILDFDDHPIPVMRDDQGRALEKTKTGGLRTVIDMRNIPPLDGYEVRSARESIRFLMQERESEERESALKEIHDEVRKVSERRRLRAREKLIEGGAFASLF